MERLTEYFELGAYTDRRNNIIDVSDKLPLFENGVIMGKAIDKLAEFEDFMEEMDFEDLEHLKLRLKNLTNGAKYYSIWLELKEWLYKDITNGEYYFKLIHKMQELEQEFCAKVQ